jgi:hypothetical protein
MHLCTSDLYVLCVMIFYACRSITWASGMALAYRLDAIPQGPKKLSISRAQPSPTCPRNGYARIENHYAHGTYKSEVQRWFYVQEPTGDLKGL